jgi:hypothetical protein
VDKSKKFWSITAPVRWKHTPQNLTLISVSLLLRKRHVHTFCNNDLSTAQPYVTRNYTYVERLIMKTEDTNFPVTFSDNFLTNFGRRRKRHSQDRKCCQISHLCVCVFTVLGLVIQFRSQKYFRERSVDYKITPLKNSIFGERYLTDDTQCPSLPLNQYILVGQGTILP